MSISLPVEPLEKAPAAPVFGRVFTEHMVHGQWTLGRGWHSMHVTRRGEVPIDPAAAVLNYGQAMFEGLKAFRGADGGLQVFRLDAHLKRMHGGAERLAMPSIDIEKTRALILDLLRKDASWAPTGPGTALYLRPLLVATEPFLGVRPSQEYAFFVLISPVGAYYEGGAKPLRIWVEREHVRAAPGGLGAVKTSANYVASLAAAARAKTFGFDQVLWLDAIERRWVEEVGTMNLFVRFEDEIVTPPLNGTILPGITRDSVLTLLRSWGLRVRERAISLDEITEAADNGTLREVFGTGTAAVIAPVGELGIGDRHLAVPHNGGIAGKLLEALTEIQRGERADVHGWITRV